MKVKVSTEKVVTPETRPAAPLTAPQAPLPGNHFSPSKGHSATPRYALIVLGSQKLNKNRIIKNMFMYFVHNVWAH
jgi:hypothetical protein